MQLRELRRVLQSIVLAGLPMGCDLLGETPRKPTCGGWTEYGATSLALEHPFSAPLALRIESCRVDVDACVELCRYALRSSSFGSITACDVTLYAQAVTADVDYVIHHSGPECLGVGRRPAGLLDPRVHACDTAAGRWFAHVAWLEAASIPAFIYLARELAAFGAPQALRDATIAAAHDEIRHAQIMAALARRHGATPPRVDLAPPRERSIVDFAIENAVEGCVHETWGAVVALWQARRAGDPALRRVFHGIAADESRHAALAWAIDSWVSARLDAGARAHVVRARAEAAQALIGAEHPTDAAILGLPDGVRARGLLERMNASLWRMS